jgi:DivIVA domain-containing protein
MDVTARELRESDLGESFRGYNRDEVEDLLERAAATIEELELRVQQLGAQLAAASAASTAAVIDVSGAPDTANLEAENAEKAARTLMLAQRVADEAVSDAKAQAREIVGGAETRSKKLIADAEVEVRRIHEVERVRVEHELRELEARRSELDDVVDALVAYEKDYRDRLAAVIRSDLDRVERRDAITTSSRPTFSGPTIPAPVEPGEITGPVGSGAGQDATQLFEAVPSGGVPYLSESDPATRTAWREGSEASGAGDTIDLATEATEGGDTGATADASEAGHLEAATAEVVTDNDDNDDFFASLRDATSEHAVLTPVEERMFESDERESGLRDVFRRRR